MEDSQLELITGTAKNTPACPQCRGTGTVTCPDCEGSGEVDDNDD
jgi:DnaJ-class molecular chaperone